MSPSATIIQRIVALATNGSHCHVECVFGRRTASGNVALENRCYTAYMGTTFGEYAVERQTYNDEDWDFLFVPITTQQELIARGWIRRNLGLQYDYLDAITCPLMSMYAPREAHDHLRKSLFCSQAALCVLQRMGVMPRKLQRVAPRHCSPVALFGLLHGECERVLFEDCRVVGSKRIVNGPGNCSSA